MKYEDLTGRIMFFPRGECFFEFLYAFDWEPDLAKIGRRMMIRDLKDGTEINTHFVEEIGTEFYMAPPDYSTEKMEAYLNAVKQREDIYHIQTDVEEEIYAYHNRLFGDEASPQPVERSDPPPASEEEYAQQVQQFFVDYISPGLEAAAVARESLHIGVFAMLEAIKWMVEHNPHSEDSIEEFEDYVNRFLEDWRTRQNLH